MFNPNDHMMKLKGKDYLEVKWRVVWFREDHPDWCINTDCIVQDQDHAIFKAIICDENGIQKSAGHGSESKKDFADFLEKAETKAIGRALAMLGYGTQFVADELDEGERIVDSPVNRKQEQPKEQPKPVEAKPAKSMKGLMEKAMMGLECRNKGLIYYLFDMQDHSPHPRASRKRDWKEREREERRERGSVGVLPPPTSWLQG